jgi:hypothetical protein
MDQTDLLRKTVEVLDGLAIPYALVGSFASSTWGEPRMTQVIDVLVDLKPSQVESLCAAFPDPEFYVSTSAARDAAQAKGQFNVIHPSSGNKIDFMVAGRTAWAAAQLQRRQRVPLFVDRVAYVAAPEDVILGKLVYYREGESEKHLRDIAGILRISADAVDRGYITRFAAQLGVADIWQAVQQRVDGTS